VYLQKGGVYILVQAQSVFDAIAGDAYRHRRLAHASTVVWIEKNFFSVSFLFVLL
jgi:hypothetical protein